MNTLYRIYTEDINRNEVLEIVAKYFDAFTVIPCKGAWKGAHESSLIIEIIDSDVIAPKVIYCAETIKYTNKQESVLITKSTIESELV